MIVANKLRELDAATVVAEVFGLKLEANGIIRPETGYCCISYRLRSDGKVVLETNSFQELDTYLAGLVMEQTIFRAN